MPAHPRKFGNWTVVSPLGDGGMADAFVVARRIGSRVMLAALKTPKFTPDDQSYAMFRDEASLACSLSHPNIVRGLEFDDNRKSPFLVMEYIDGPNLAKLAHKTTLPLHVASFVVAEIAKGLDYIHNLFDCEHQVDGSIRPTHVLAVHRDCTMANVFISSFGGVSLADLGIAVFTGREDKTSTLSFKANLQYLPPQVFRLYHSMTNAELTAQQAAEIAQQRDSMTKHPSYDIYMLGEIMYRLLHGQPPFADAVARTSGSMQPLRDDLPEPVRILLLEMLAAQADQRPSARDVTRRLHEAVPDTVVAQQELARLVQRYLQEHGKTCPPAYEIVPPHLVPYVQLRERALHALVEQDHDAYFEHSSDELPATADHARRPAKKLPAASASPWRARNLLAAAAVVLGAGGAWALTGERPASLAPRTTPLVQAAAPHEAPATALREVAPVPAATSAPTPTPASPASAQPSAAASSAAPPAPEDSGAAETAPESPTEPSRRSRKHSRSSAASSEVFCDLLILDTEDYSNDETRVDGRKATPLALPGQASIPVALGSHVVTIQRRNGTATRNINVRTKKDCKLQF